MKRIAVLLAGGLGLVAISAPFEVPWALVTGWVLFLVRVVPEISIDWGVAAVGSTAVVLFAVGTHAAGRAWYRQRPTEAGTGRGWRLRWSLAGTATVFLLFAAGISTIGVTHQVGWLLTAPGPLQVPTLRDEWYWRSPDNLRRFHNGIEYAGSGGEIFPASTFAPDGSMLHSWETALLPYVDYSTSQIDFNRPWNDPHNAPYFQCVIPAFINPDLRAPLSDAEGYGLSHYAANGRVLAGNKSMKLSDITDGTSTTLLVGEVNADFRPWGHPVKWRDPAKGINRSPHGFGGSRRSGGANFLMADGSVRFVSERVSADVLRALATPDGGEPVDMTVL